MKMSEDIITIKPIAHVESDFKTKFALPRQSGLASSLRSKIVFEREYSVREAFRELDGYSHIWLIWGFSLSDKKEWSPTVRPPRLGGNKRVGVFSTRSPYRPNPLALSCVELEKIEFKDGIAILHVLGADMASVTPVYDVKPYLPFTDSRPDALAGFASDVAGEALDVVFEDGCADALTEDERSSLVSVLSQDPRPHYQDDPLRIYGFDFGKYEVGFRVEDGCAHVVCIK